MKGVKGRLLKKLQTIKAIGYLKPERILQVNAFEGYVHTSPPKSNSVARKPLVSILENPKNVVENDGLMQQPEIIDVTELMKDLEDQESEFDDDINDKENIKPKKKSKIPDDFEENAEFSISSESKNEVLESTEFRKDDEKHVPLPEIDMSSFRRPDLDSGSLFDPNLLAAFEQAVMEVKAQEEADRRVRIEEINWQEIEEGPPLKSRKIEEIADPLVEFEEKCPPGGRDTVILYTTGLRGIRKTFNDCHRIRSLLENLRVLFYERDISMHSEYRDELWKVSGEKLVPPRLFIKGRYIGGAAEVLGLHEQGKLKPLLEGIPIDKSEGPCEGCAGIRFIVCFNCNGSQKIVPEGNDEVMNCSECNENGVIICPLCC
ncbi:Glutaredoxin family protein [Forsythia ovata]|uniref:Glutaredoxin family protein n=1 Tax=Forsythia ovata TaxID=205694 RepID=A0ABD1X106_9LAMI